MQWTNNRDQLVVSTTDISTHSKIQISKSKWNKLRETVLKKYNYTCRCCGGVYAKYLLCIHLDN
ncbi:MAG: hypothetical protein Homavirus28_8, partial [Homavirus sp.]